jgi:hypothetical protein
LKTATTENTTAQNPLVIGQGLGALLAVATFIQDAANQASEDQTVESSTSPKSSKKQTLPPVVTWVTGTRARLPYFLHAPFSESNAQAFYAFCEEFLGVHAVREPAELGVYWYKNRKWRKIPKIQGLDHLPLPQLGKSFELALQTRTQVSLEEWAMSLYETLLTHPRVKVLKTDLAEIKAEEKTIHLSDGTNLSYSELIFGDRPYFFRPAPSTLRGKNSYSVLQLEFTMDGSAFQESALRFIKSDFILPLQEDGQEVAIGSFEGSAESEVTSRLSLLVDPELAEDNVKVARIFRKMRGALERAFSAENLFPESLPTTYRLETYALLDADSKIHLPKSFAKVGITALFENENSDSVLSDWKAWGIERGLLDPSIGQNSVAGVPSPEAFFGEEGDTGEIEISDTPATEQ